MKMQCLLRAWDHKYNYSQTKPIHQKGAEIETGPRWSPALVCGANKYINIFNLDYSGNGEPQAGAGRGSVPSKSWFLPKPTLFLTQCS